MNAPPPHRVMLTPAEAAALDAASLGRLRRDRPSAAVKAALRELSARVLENERAVTEARP